MWRRSDARLRHICHFFIIYKPFMWRRSDARLRHVCHLFIIHKPFMWCRPDARLRHDLSYYPFQGVASDTRSVHSISTPVLHIHILPACVHHEFCLFRD